MPNRKPGRKVTTRPKKKVRKVSFGKKVGGGTKTAAQKRRERQARALKGIF